MSEVKAGLGYTEEHEWAEAQGSSVVRIGITDFAQSQLGDIVFVELPEVGATLEANETMGTIESVKTVSDLFSPVSGTVVKVNEALLDSPEKVNEEPYGEGWIVEVEVSGDAAEAVAALLDADKYAEFIANK
ncbi:glycine cleavage system protein GcvH [Cohnella thailandensis]|uniref:Glycine cleavage system H protein n=1 Tax=Cohnella thailandensis TaxID=557557 RepID=A0A841SQV6_9BACL|nr:glycine cleavage system protein GcvH [Cohnella thailandensis]MBB6634793.1 glycine cleavage system protein GcvH [Cohnella thailandensis]MBP1975986.1 glycine cleavage system H protein [Cohnella thailandensis]